MTSEQQRLHEQHKARLARIQNNAFRAPEPPKPVFAPRDKFHHLNGGFPRVGNIGAAVGRENAAPRVTMATPQAQYLQATAPHP